MKRFPRARGSRRSRYGAGNGSKILLGGLIAYGLRRHGFRSRRGGRAKLPLPLFFLLLFLEEISLALGKRIIGLRQLAILRLGGLETKHRVSHFRPPRCKRCR